MGVPAFYRWLSEKYPKTIVNAVEECALKIEGRRRFNLIDIEAENPNGQEIDNLFIDMNGIIHPCAHPEEGEQPKSEEEMFLRLMEYVDRLVACVRPRRLLYMAIDGVAPRAKMNQQRARRFRSAQEAKERAEVEAEVREYMELMGQKTPAKQTSWDSNVITPGTKFMAKLSKFMRFYIRDRINNCPGWKKFKVILSDAGVPGEGEHKLMSFIRNQRCQPNYDPNQHHVLHGLDADLIMLGLATHEVKFSILREEVLFGKAKYEKEKEAKMILDGNGVNVNVGKRKRGEFGEHDGDIETHDGLKPFQFLHISILREYLAIEFEPLRERLPFPYDFERIVDDFVFLCFFVGNDFLPHLPCLDIRDGAIDYLLLVYAKLLPSLGGYLTKPQGEIDLKNVDVLLAEVGSVEDVIFQRRMVKERQNNMRQQQRLTYQQRDQILATAGRENAVSVKKVKTGEQSVAVEDKVIQNNSLSPADVLKAHIKEKETAKLDKFKNEIIDSVRLGEPGWKTRYYDDKLKAHDIETGGGREKVFQSYVEGLCWVMRYYYNGCASWQWFYPFHYAPFASDLKNIDQFTIEFIQGKPFCPFEQLMGVFPADSKHALPKPYQWLMTDPESPIIDFYPQEIPMDPNGKAMPWLWVVLLPFIDEERLLAAMAPVNAKLTDGAKKRNERYGKELIFFHAQMKQTHASVENPVVSLDYGTLQMFGALEYWEPCDFPLGCTVPSPKKSKSSKNQTESIESDLTDIPDNQCLSFAFVSPPPGPHTSTILADAIVADPVLVDPLERAISVPHLGRGNINIVDLAGPVMTAIQTRNQHNNHHNHRMHNYPQQQQMHQQPRNTNHQTRPYQQQNQNAWNPLQNHQAHHFSSSSQNSQHIGYNQSGEYRGKHTGSNHASGRSGSSGFGVGFGVAKNNSPQPFRHQAPPAYARQYHPSSASSLSGYPRHAPPPLPPPVTSYQGGRNSYDPHVVPRGINHDQAYYYRQHGSQYPSSQNSYGQIQSSGMAGSRSSYYPHHQNARSMAQPPVVSQASAARQTPPNMEALKKGLRNMHQQRGTHLDKPSSSNYPQQRYDR